MAIYYIVPKWFFGVDIALEMLFLIATLAVGIASYKIYRISREKSMHSFSISFFFIAASYLAWMIINIIALSSFQKFPHIFTLQEIFLIGAIGLYAHILLFSVGLITLTYATLPKKDSRVYYLLLGLGLSAIVASTNKIITFRVISVFLLSSIVYHFFMQWREHRSKNLFYSFAAFTILLASNLEFAFSTNYYLAYVVGHILELAAYIIILRNLIKITLVKKPNSNEQKKNKT